MSEIPKSKLVCFVCRKNYGVIFINDELYLEVYFDFCDSCVGRMMSDFERQFRRRRERTSET